MRLPRAVTEHDQHVEFRRAPDWWCLVEDESEHPEYAGAFSLVLSDAIHAALFRYGLPKVMWPALEARVRASRLSEYDYLRALFFELAATLPEADPYVPRAIEKRIQTRLNFSKDDWAALGVWQQQHDNARIVDSVSSLVGPLITVFDQSNFALGRLRAQMRREGRTTVDFIGQSIAASLYKPAGQ